MADNTIPALDVTPLAQFSQEEINLLIQTVSYASNAKSKVIKIPLDSLEELSDHKPSARQLFMRDLEKSFDKLMELSLYLEDMPNYRLDKFRMFTGYCIYSAGEDAYVEITGHDRALPLVNTLDQWVLDSLQEFLALHSGYSKTMFRLLKKYSHTGCVTLPKKDFIEQMSIPPSYKQGDIDRSVLAPIQNELAALFRNLTIEKIYGTGRGKPVQGYRFTFETEE